MDQSRRLKKWICPKYIICSVDDVILLMKFRQIGVIPRESLPVLFVLGRHPKLKESDDELEGLLQYAGDGID